MMQWIQRGTRLFSGLMFFVVVSNNLLVSRLFTLDSMLHALLYGVATAILCWFAGIIICDIIIKGMITHINDPSVDALIDGGIGQRIKMMQEQNVPGGEELPFTKETSKNSSNR